MCFAVSILYPSKPNSSVKLEIQARNVESTKELDWSRSLKKHKNVDAFVGIWLFFTRQWCEQPALLDLLLVGEVLDDAELVVVLRLVEGDVFVKVERVWAVRVAVVLNYSSVCYKIKRQKSNSVFAWSPMWLGTTSTITQMSLKFKNNIFFKKPWMVLVISRLSWHSSTSSLRSWADPKFSLSLKMSRAAYPW